MIEFNSNNNIGEVHWGNNKLSEVYYGEHLIWPVETSNKLVLTYSGDTDYVIKCNGNVNIVSDDTTPTGKSYENCTGAVIGNCVEYIGAMAFYAFPGLTSVSFGENVRIIADNAFTSCSNLASVSFNDGLTQINAAAFKHCNMSSVVLPSSIKQIRDEAFMFCSNMQSITVLATTPPKMVGTRIIVDDEIVTAYSTFNHTGDCPILVPQESLQAYLDADGWSTYASRIRAIS